VIRPRSLANIHANTSDRNCGHPRKFRTVLTTKLCGKVRFKALAVKINESLNFVEQYFTMFNFMFLGYTNNYTKIQQI
jgi:hypothetical protein